MIVTILVIGFFITLYLYLSKVWTAPPAWAEKIPSPQHNLLLGSWNDITFYPSELQNILQQYDEQFGGITFLRKGLFTPNQLIVTDPDASLKIMQFQEKGKTTSDINLLAPGNIQSLSGSEYLKQKHMFNKAFSVEAVKQYFPSIENSVKDMVNFLDKKVETNEIIDAGKMFKQITADILGDLLFSEQLGALHGNRTIIDDVSTLADEIQSTAFNPLLKLLKIFKILALRTKIEKSILQYVQKKKEVPNPEKKDILSQLIYAKGETGQPLPELTIVREIIMLITAAYETTAHSMAFVVFHLIENPEALHKLRKEMDGVWGYKDQIHEEDYDKLKFLDICIKEANRLSNVCFSVFRVCEEDVQVGDFTVPKGTPVWVPFSIMHKNPKIWDNPEKFMPQRFFTSTERPLKYFNPFGTGARECIGMNLAKLEMTVILSKLIRGYDFEAVPGQNYETKMGVTNYFKYPFEIIVKKRMH